MAFLVKEPMYHRKELNELPLKTGMTYLGNALIGGFHKEALKLWSSLEVEVGDQLIPHTNLTGIHFKVKKKNEIR